MDEEKLLKRKLRKKEMDRIRHAKQRLEQPEKVAADKAKDHAKHKEKRQATHKAWLENHPNWTADWETKHRIKRNQQRRLVGARRRACKPEETRAYMDQWRRDNVERIVRTYEEYKERRNHRRRERRSTETEFKIKDVLRSRFRAALKNNQKSGSALYFLGCSVDEVKKHLESMFELGMTWDNWGHGKGKWHIDHIMPFDAFDLTNLQHLFLVNHYCNLQPLWSEINFAKNNKAPSMELCLN